MSVNGEMDGAPVKLGLPIGDLVGGVFAPAAISSALFEREKTGRGRLIDVSLFDGLIGMLGYLPQYSWFEGTDPKPVGSSHINIVPYGTFKTKDGAIVIACLTNAFWKKLCSCLELDSLIDDPRFTDMEARKRHRDELQVILEDRTQMFPKLDLHRLLDQHDVPNAPVLSVMEALESPHAKAREMVEITKHETLGEIPVVGRPVKFPGHEQRKISAPPVLGQHTRQVLRDLLHLDQDEIEALIESKACQ